MPCPIAAAGGGPYQVPAPLARLVRAHLPRCCGPGCSMPAARCDLDHRIPWPKGPTCTCNLAPLCRTHHRAKTLHGWTLHRVSTDPTDPTLVWTSPLGRVYHVVPERRWLSARSASLTARPTRRDQSDQPARPPDPIPYPPPSRYDGDPPY